MNTRHLLLSFSLLLTTSFVFGQVDVNPAIKSKFESFIKFSNEKQWDKAFDLVYPKLFTRVAKQDVVDLMNGMEMDGMTMNLQNAQITSSSAPMQEGKETFVRIGYTTNMNVSIEQGGMYDSPKAIQAIDEQFKATYGGRSVKWDQEMKQFNILASKAIMAIDPGNGDWKLIEINKDQPELMAFLFSPAIIEALVLVE